MSYMNYKEDAAVLPESVQSAIRAVEMAAVNLREVIANNDYRTSETPLYDALDEIVEDLRNGDHD
jgi:hypothetical protein